MIVRPLDLQRALREEFGLVPLTAVQRRGLSRKELRREQKRESRRRRADQVSGRIVGRFVESGGELTERDAVAFAVSGFSVWMWIVQPLVVAFVKQVARWTWRWLQEQQSRQMGVI